MRVIYSLTDQTRKVFAFGVAAIAEEMSVAAQYLHAVLSGTETDIFAKFERLYAACVRAGAPVCHWDNRLREIRAKYQPKDLARPVECLAEKIRTDALTTGRILEALKNGKIDDREVPGLLEAIEGERKVLEQIEEMIAYRNEVASA